MNSYVLSYKDSFGDRITKTVKANSIYDIYDWVKKKNYTSIYVHIVYPVFDWD